MPPTVPPGSEARRVYRKGSVCEPAVAGVKSECVILQGVQAAGGIAVRLGSVFVNIAVFNII